MAAEPNQQPIPRAVISAFARDGLLRASINLGNPILAGRDAAGEPAGVPVEVRALLATFVEEMKASGFVADALTRHRIEGATVAPPA